MLDIYSVYICNQVSRVAIVAPVNYCYFNLPGNIL